ncbi:S-layer homology domain-containing protein, partial [Paenibacillus sp.]|uniref:S-layer homology domain-containing protein n=1 Tax=Paenibacillus sp. TaxID=58172 RepID=UPI0028A90325
MKKMWRGLMTGILGISMLLGSLGSVSAAPVPKDIQGHWAQGQLQEWLDRGYLGGYPDGTVKPNKAITRGEYVTLINRLFGFTQKATVSFKDMKSTNWNYSEVAKAVKAGYIGGYEDNTFRPNNPLTRQEAAVITAKLLKLNTNTTSNKFKDNAQIAAWAKGAVAAAADKKIINGYPDGTFGPKRSLTRAEAVGIINSSVIHYPGSGTGGGVIPTPTPTATPTPIATPMPTATPGGGSGGGGNVTTPTVTGATYGNVGSVTADVYLTPSVTGAVYYVVAPYTANVSAPSALQVEKGQISNGTAGVHHGSAATVANIRVTFSVYGLNPGTEYATYIAVADASGKLSDVTTVRLTTAQVTASSITLFEPGQAGTVTADVYVKYGVTGGAPTPVRYVVLPANEKAPSAAQISLGQNSAGTALTAPWTDTLTFAP